METRPTTPGYFFDEMGIRRWWDGEKINDAAAPSRVNAVPRIPGRLSGFILGLVGVVLILTTMNSMILFPAPVAGILGIVQSSRALHRIPANTRGRGLAITGLVLSIITLALAAITWVGVILFPRY